MNRLSSTLVCSAKSHFKDDLIGSCKYCNEIIYWRPYNDGIDRKICLRCVVNKNELN